MDSPEVVGVSMLERPAVIDLRDTHTQSSSQPPLPRISIVIPTKNEAKNLRCVLPLIPTTVHEVLIVDAGSSDGTAEAARELFPNARVLDEPQQGKGAALRRGFIEATGEFVVALDADGSADPREIPAFIGALEAGADMAKGTRFRQGGGTSDMERHRMLGNWCLQTLVNALFGGQYSDLCYGFFAVRRDAVEALFGEAEEINGFEIETYLNIRALRLGLEIREVPSFEYRRIHGTSNLRAIRDGFRILRVIAKEFVQTDPDAALQRARRQGQSKRTLVHAALKSP